MEKQVAALFGKARGVMVNSGSSALYLAVELLGLEPGDEVVTCGLTFSTDIAPIVRAGATPVLVDAEPDTFCIDVARIEEMITPRTARAARPQPHRQRPRLGRDPGDRRPPRPRHRRGLVRHPGAAAAGHADRRAVDVHRHQLRQLAHPHLRRQRRDAAARRRRAARPRADAAPLGAPFRGAVLRHQAGRALLLGGPRRHPLRQPVHLRRAGLELRALGDGRGVRPRPARRSSTPTSPAAGAPSTGTPSSSPSTATGSPSPARPPGSRPRGSATRCSSRPTPGFTRPELQEHLDGHGIDTRTIWTGNVARQPMLARRAPS